jgi:DamX protein
VHYTIQLMGDRHADRLHAFVRKLRPSTPLASIRVKRKDKPWFLLVEGDYASEEEAIAAIRALPREMKGGGAWPRLFASLQDEMVAGNH